MKHKFMCPHINQPAKLYGTAKTIKMIVCSYHVTCAFQSESTLYNCLNVRELPARNRREVRNLSDCTVSARYLYGAFDCMYKNIQSNAPYI